MKRKIIIGISAGCMALGGILCNTQPLQTAGGTGSELVGTACYTASPAREPAANARVYVFDETYLTDTSSSFQAPWAVKTDNKGAFRVSGLLPGTYIVEIVDSAGRSIAARTVVNERQTVHLDTLLVAPPGAVRMPFMPLASGFTGSLWYVRVYGTRLVAHGLVDSSGVLMGHLPSGIALSINLLIPGPVPINLDFNGITVAPDSTRTLPAFPINGPLLK
jgi:hypothetical protein